MSRRGWEGIDKPLEARFFMNGIGVSEEAMMGFGGCFGLYRVYCRCVALILEDLVCWTVYRV